MLDDQAYAFEQTARGPYAVVSVNGELDIAAVDELRESVRLASELSDHVVVDLRAVRFMDTYALRALVELQREALGETRCSLHVIPGGGVQRLLDVTAARPSLRWISPEQLQG
jgi:anti-anti-sigma factor